MCSCHLTTSPACSWQDDSGRLGSECVSAKCVFKGRRRGHGWSRSRPRGGWSLERGGLLTRIRRNRAKTVMKTILVGTVVNRSPFESGLSVGRRSLVSYKSLSVRNRKLRMERGILSFRLQRSLSCGGSVALRSYFRHSGSARIPGGGVRGFRHSGIRRLALRET